MRYLLKPLFIVHKQNFSDMKYSAVFTISGFFTQQFYCEGESVRSLVNELEKVQDLDCLARQASFMGTEEDAKEAEKLTQWLSRDYELEDLDDLDFHFSIGSIKCDGRALGKKASEELRKKFNL